MQSCCILCVQTCCSVEDDCCCTERHHLRHQLLAVHDVTNPTATLVLGLQLCIAETEVPAADTTKAGNQSIWSVTGNEGYDLVTFEHRRSIEADYHAVNCLANQPQVIISTVITEPFNLPSVTLVLPHGG